MSTTDIARLVRERLGLAEGPQPVTLAEAKRIHDEVAAIKRANNPLRRALA